MKNNCGEATAEIKLTVIDKPTPPGAPEPVAVTDDSITLYWKVPESDGNSPIIQYNLEYHDKKTEKWTKTVEKITQTTHTVTKLVKESELTFRVTAVNEVGESEPSIQSSYIKVIAPTKMESPIVQEPLKDIVSGLNKEITLSCVISGTPSPNIEWSHNGKVIKENVTYENRLAKLFITKTTEKSEGTYTCKASNTEGKAETSCKLTVQEAPTLHISEELISQKLTVGSTWTLSVSFTGYPKPTIKWLRENEEVKETKHIKIKTVENVTTITNSDLQREDSANYSITAVNNAGSACQFASLQIIGEFNIFIFYNS